MANTNKLIDLSRLSRFWDKVKAVLQDTSDTNAENHMGFYLDENGGLCQKNER